MAGQVVHLEIPSKDTEKSRAFWGGLFGWKFEQFPGPTEYHMTRIDDTTGAAISADRDRPVRGSTSTWTTSKPELRA